MRPESVQPAAAPGPRGRTRGGIGAPLTSLPSTARVQRDAPLLGDRRRTQPGPSGAPAPQATPPQATPPPAATTSPSTPAAMPIRSSAAAPVQRAAEGERRPHPRTPSGTSTGTGTGPGTATPAPGTAASPATPPAPVRIRNIGPRQEAGRPLATPSAGTAAPTPTVQRSRTLLSGRDLKVNTGAAEGFSAAPTATAGGSTARPVVAATWRRDVQQPGQAEPANARTDAPRPGGHQTSAGVTPRRSAPRTRTPGAAPTTAAAPAPTMAPTAAAPTSGATVQRAGHAAPAPRRTTAGGRSTTAPKAAPGQQAPQAERTTRTATAPARSGSAIGGALQRLVQRRSVRNTATTTPSSPSPQARPAGQTPQQSASTRPASPSPSPSLSPPRSASSQHSGHNTPTPQSAPPTRAVPVVRPHPPVAPPPGATVVPVQRMPLPVVPDPAGPPPAGPAPGGDAPLAGPPALSVRVPPRPHTPASGPSGTGPSPSASASPGVGTTPGRPPTQAQVLQRAAAQAGLTGIPVTAVPPKSTRTGTRADTQTGARRSTQPGVPKPVQRAADDTSGFAPTSETPTENAASTASRLSGSEIEELARRLLDPVSRLIRADMRRGRERAGRLHDGRR
ncbi:hypothetical protein ACFWRT_08185 [Streptomyces cyaneofuscatus]|uniref:hypothetical protein n=1 Tax=Streptomyces cyaneofuscatus TaxID=66883 RepID=UPI003646EB2D